MHKMYSERQVNGPMHYHYLSNLIFTLQLLVIIPLFLSSLSFEDNFYVQVYYRNP